jgi:hypothetical protein
VPWDLPKLLLSVGELALAPVPASSLFFPATAEFCLVETQLPVVRAWTVTTRGRVLGNGGRRGSHSTVVRGRTKRARVLALELASHQLRGSEITLCIIIWLEELVEHRESGGSTQSWIHSGLRELREVVGKELQCGFTERSGIRSRMLMGRAEGLSLNSGNSRILRDDHIVQLLSVSGGESWHRVCEIGGHDILKLLVEATSGLGLAELRSRRSIVHAGLNKGVPELPLGSIIIDLEVLLIATGK